MSCITENQPLKLETTITDDGNTLAAPVTSATYDYWIPGNNTSIKDGSWTATVIDGAAGTIEYDIAADTLTEGLWRVQARGVSGGLEFPACADSITVKGSGGL